MLLRAHQGTLARQIISPVVKERKKKLALCLSLDGPNERSLSSKKKWTPAARFLHGLLPAPPRAGFVSLVLTLHNVGILAHRSIL